MPLYTGSFLAAWKSTRLSRGLRTLEAVLRQAAAKAAGERPSQAARTRTARVVSPLGHSPSSPLTSSTTVT